MKEWVLILGLSISVSTFAAEGEWWDKTRSSAGKAAEAVDKAAHKAVEVGRETASDIKENETVQKGWKATKEAGQKTGSWLEKTFSGDKSAD